MTGIADTHHPFMREQMTVARIAGGHHAIEHINAPAHCFDNIRRRAHAHQIPGPVGRQALRQIIQYPPTVFRRLAYRQAAYGIAIKTDFHQSL